MNQLIDFSQYQYKKDTSKTRMSSGGSEFVPLASDICDDEYKLTMDILIHNYPKKISFTIDDAALQMNVSKEFIRRRIKSGRIKVIYYGDKPMIHISELANLLTKGIK